ncbi:MAG: hypothetical protein LUD68_00315 [Rikenellaceae bacterium]|nr:hypothetical protein [Rikenellaceae bacterium]
MEFLRHERNATDKKTFRERYRALTHRSFEFDYRFHEKLIEGSLAHPDPWKIEITDEEILNVHGANPEDLRLFVMGKHIPYHIPPYPPTIDRIVIDALALKAALLHFEKTAFHILPGKILSLIEKKEHESRLKAREVPRTPLRHEPSGLEVGDYIYIREYADHYLFGKVASLDEWNKNWVRFNGLKKDGRESKRPLKMGFIPDIRYILKPEVAEPEIEAGRIKFPPRFLQLFKEKGHKNPLFKNRRKSSSS